MEKLRPNEDTRKIVSYFEHETRPHTDFPQDLAEIKRYFNTLIICVSEVTLDTRQKELKEIVRDSQQSNIMTMADPWGVGHVFGGEGKSHFKETGEVPCFCNPTFDRLMTRWVDVVSDAGVDGIYFDEPEARCPDHDEVSLIAKYSGYAKDRGLYTSVAVTADYRRTDLPSKMSAISSVDDIGTDPYWPNVFTEIPKRERQEYVAKWTKLVKEAASEHGKDCHIWLQGFGIARDDIGMITELAQVIKNNGVRDIAFWGFKGCESLFPYQESSPLASPSDIWQQAKLVFQAKE